MHTLPLFREGREIVLKGPLLTRYEKQHIFGL